MELFNIELRSADQLSAAEKLPKIPALVSEYRAIESSEFANRKNGEFFRVSVEGKNKASGSAGIAYLNEMKVEMKNGSEWNQIYSTGMRQYRGAYNYEIDDWDLAIYDPVILRESKDKAQVAFRTGVGNIKIFSFSKKGLIKPGDSFSWRDYSDQLDRIELVKNMVNDPELFRQYVSKSIKENRWHTSDNTFLNDGELIVQFANHASRDYDAATDKYQFCFLVKGKGIAVSEVLYSGLRNPTSQFSTNYAYLEKAELISADDKQIVIEVELSARRQGWTQAYRFTIRL